MLCTLRCTLPLKTLKNLLQVRSRSAERAGICDRPTILTRWKSLVRIQRRPLDLRRLLSGIPVRNRRRSGRLNEPPPPAVAAAGGGERRPSLVRALIQDLFRIGGVSWLAAHGLGIVARRSRGRPTS